MDPKGLSAGCNQFEALSNSPPAYLDALGLDVQVFWVEGAKVPLTPGGLEEAIIKPLKEEFKNEKKISWHGYQVGLGGAKELDGMRVRRAIANCKKGDETVLIAYSWGADAVLHGLLAKVNAQGFKVDPAFIDKIYTIDPIFGNPLTDGNDAVPKFTPIPFPFPTGFAGFLPLNVQFGEWQNWYQRSDSGGSLLGIPLRGRVIPDFRVINHEVGSAEIKKAGNPKAGHSAIVNHPAIKKTINEGIHKLLDQENKKK